MLYRRERIRGWRENNFAAKFYAGPITLASPDAGLTDHKSRDHPISRSLLLPDPDGLFSPVAMASALLQAAKASTSSVMRLASVKASLRSDSRSATKDASSMHSNKLSRDRPVPANWRALMYAKIVSGKYAARMSRSSTSPPVTSNLLVIWSQISKPSHKHTLNCRYQPSLQQGLHKVFDVVDRLADWTPEVPVSMSESARKLVSEFQILE